MDKRFKISILSFISGLAVLLLPALFLPSCSTEVKLNMKELQGEYLECSPGTWSIPQKPAFSFTLDGKGGMEFGEAETSKKGPKSNFPVQGKNMEGKLELLPKQSSFDRYLVNNSYLIKVTVTYTDETGAKRTWTSENAKLVCDGEGPVIAIEDFDGVEIVSFRKKVIEDDLD